jgi:hypothetical protein
MKKIQINSNEVALYATTVSMGVAEVQVIWARYAAFLVINGLLVSANTSQSIQPWLVVSLGVIGLVVNGVWLVLNLAGWLNMLHWYHVAHGLLPTGSGMRLPTEPFADKPKSPAGAIYICAQSIPFVLLVASVLGLQYGLSEIPGLWLSPTVITVALALGVGIFVLLIGRSLKKQATEYVVH